MADYKRLGDYIVAVDERNSDLSITLSQGINNNKYFQQPRQVAENSKNDKIVRHGYFAYNRATTRNGDKISIAYREGEDCTVSSAYQVFYIKDEELLNPHYLLLWFKRPTFDRYARFKSHGSAHEFFEWDEMCNVMLPVPSIEEQRRIVEQYQTVERRIKNNEKLIALLENTAQTIFRHRFVENIDPNNLPEGWRMGHINDIATLEVGGDKPNVFSETKTSECKVPIYSNGIDEKGIYGFTNEATISEESVTISARGTIGYCFLRFEPYVPIVRLISAIPYNRKSLYFVYFLLKMQNIKGDG
ncbi:MAG: restriction endonuclease subunit S, partial [Aeriscardovia sp.]|nr:restriction endonuclease subunit S [Aeriscardovia sp.]